MLFVFGLVVGFLISWLVDRRHEKRAIAKAVVLARLGKLVA